MMLRPFSALGVALLSFAAGELRAQTIYTATFDNADYYMSGSLQCGSPTVGRYVPLRGGPILTANVTTIYQKHPSATECTIATGTYTLNAPNEPFTITL